MKKFIKLTYLLVAVAELLAFNCKKDEPLQPATTGDFTFSPASPTIQTAVLFIATAQNATSY
ncbi:hypothetical protein [Rhodoflexus sp.]